jgi:hypothetical protein
MRRQKVRHSLAVTGGLVQTAERRQKRGDTCGVVPGGRRVTISEDPEPRLAPDVIVETVRGHFVYEGEQVERRLREHLRRGQITLGVGLTVLVLFLTLAQLTASLTAGPLREILREGLVITGWVAMWRPLEILLYDWWPLIDERRQVRRILDAQVSIRYHEAKTPAAGNRDGAHTTGHNDMADIVGR